MEPSVDIQYILNTFSFLMSAVLVMWMAAGFTMLEAGMVRTKSVNTILLKNIGLFSIAGIMYWAFGYNLMYSGVDGGWIGTLMPWSPSDTAPTEGGGYASASDWFFQMVFVATACSIVSGTVAERIKIWPFMFFSVVLTGVIYPIVGAWTWGGGWLSELGFSDFAGSTIVHSVGGWAALVGAILLGARAGRYTNGKTNPMPGSMMPLATLGVFILWMGWFGFNGGSVLALGTVADATTMATVYVNTTLAAAAGVVACMIASGIIYKKIDLTFVLNGALAGLVAITAGPDTPSPELAIMIGAVGGILAMVAVTVLDKLKIDDVVGAVPVHLVAGIWGTLAVPLSNADASFLSQLIGVLAVGAFVITTSFIVWYALKKTVGIRAAGHVEESGLDMHELGSVAYPEFINNRTDYDNPVAIDAHTPVVAAE
jgi:Amt family ammonium transporter